MIRKIEIERFSLTTSKRFDVPKIVRLLIGNPLIMKEMAKHVADAGSYAPVTLLVDERADGVHFSYDKMTSLLAPYENREALEVARDLDRKVEDLLRPCCQGPAARVTGYPEAIPGNGANRPTRDL